MHTMDFCTDIAAGFTALYIPALVSSFPAITDRLTTTHDATTVTYDHHLSRCTSRNLGSRAGITPSRANGHVLERSSATVLSPPGPGPALRRGIVACKVGAEHSRRLIALM